MKKPNIILIMTDQQRADLCAREGYPLDTTPFLDSLAGEGCWFNKAYTTVPACVPARESMLTGRYPGATGVRSNPHGAESAVFTKDLFQVLGESGYRLGLSGKNHSHLDPSRTEFWYHAGHKKAEDNDTKAEYRDFERFLEDTHFHLAEEATPFPVECQHQYRVVSKSIEWIDAIRDEKEPFFLWLSFAEPHNPYQVPEPYFSMFPPESLPPLSSDEGDLPRKGFKYQWCRDALEQAFPGYPQQIDRGRSNYLGMLRLIDDQVMRLAAYLDETGLREDTLLIFLSDHGDFVGEYGLLRKGPELPDSLCRIPMIFNGPGIRSNGLSQAHVTIADVMPTICDMIDAEFPDGMQGKSFWPLLAGDDGADEILRDEFRSAYSEVGFGGLNYSADDQCNSGEHGLSISPDGKSWGSYNELNNWSQSGYMRMVRMDRWKLIYDIQGRGQLYDMENDPSELENLYAREEYQEIRTKMLEELMTWTLRAQDPLPLPRQSYTLKRNPRNYWNRPGGESEALDTIAKEE